MAIKTLRKFISGLSFGESPRWHDGALWLSDFHRHVIERVDDKGSREIIARLDDMPSGLGWLPDGRLLVVAKKSRSVLRLDRAGLTLHADLSHIATHWCNDMVVDGKGRAYVGNYGAAFSVNKPSTPATLCCVEPTGASRPVGMPLDFPNGSVVTPDGRTLLVAETLGRRISAFTISNSGDLSNHRIWATLEDAPDGICLDTAGFLWIALPYKGEVQRVAEGGKVDQRLRPTADAPIACMLGGPNRRRLYVVTSRLVPNLDDLIGTTDGRIETTDVDVPGAGWP